jgi:hypothetical protein
VELTHSFPAPAADSPRSCAAEPDCTPDASVRPVIEVELRLVKEQIAAIGGPLLVAGDPGIGEPLHPEARSRVLPEGGNDNGDQYEAACSCVWYYTLDTR